MGTDFSPRLKIVRLAKMITTMTDKFSPDYSVWYDKLVVMLVVLRQCYVPMPCRILSESRSDVRVRIWAGLEMNVRKELILAVEEESVAPEIRVN